MSIACSRDIPLLLAAFVHPCPSDTLAKRTGTSRGSWGGLSGRFVSSNPFDDIGAEAAGMRAAWVDRSGGVFDALGSPPEIVVGTLTELTNVLG
jgi:hypothetical protein